MRRRRGGRVLGVLIRGRLECLLAEHLPGMEVFSTTTLRGGRRLSRSTWAGGALRKLEVLRS